MGSPGASDSPRPASADVGGFSAHVEQAGAATVVAVSGDVDMATAPQLSKHVADAVAEGPDVVVVDLTDVRLLGSSGLAVLVSANAQSPPEVPIRIVASGRSTTRVLEMTGLDQTLAVYPTRAAALAGE